MRFTNMLRALGITMMVTMLSSCFLAQPEPITPAQRADRIANDKHDMFAHQIPIGSPITLSEAMARALKYNLDLRLKTADAVLANSELNVAQMEMLPDIVASAGYVSRSNEYAVKTSPDSNVTSFSQDRHRRVFDLQMTWNILDFGVSYINAKQKVDSYFIALERHRKMQQNIIRDVRYAYYRAVSAQKLLRQIEPMMGQVEGAISKSQKLEKSQTQKPLEALQYQRSLLATLRDLTTLRRELVNAKKELAALMNLSPSQRFNVDESPNSNPALPTNFPTDIRELEYHALQYRPEIREEDYRTRITVNEVNKAKVRMLPGFELNLGYNYDSNSFLVNNAWSNFGAQLTWNLIKIFSGPANIARAKRELLVSDIRRMALSMAIMTQVDVAYLRYNQLKKDLKVVKDEMNVSKRIYTQISEGYKAQKNSELELIQSKTDKILAQLRYDLTYAEYQNSGGQLMSSVGFDVIPIVDTRNPIRHLDNKIKASLKIQPAWVRDNYKSGYRAHLMHRQHRPEKHRHVRNANGKNVAMHKHRQMAKKSDDIGLTIPEEVLY